MSILSRNTVSWECDSCKKLNHPECNFCEFCGAQKDTTPLALKLWGNLMDKAKPLAQKAASSLGNMADKARTSISNATNKNAAPTAQPQVQQQYQPPQQFQPQQQYQPPQQFQPQQQPAQVTCSSCGAAGRPGQAFCARCGASMKAPQQSNSPVQPVQPQPRPVVPQPVQPQPQPRPVVPQPVQPQPQPRPVVPQPVQPAQPQSQAQGKTCSSCGSVNPPNEFFCRNCGSLL